MPLPDTKKILVIGPSWIGDMVMAQSLFMTLGQSHPQVEITVLAPAWSLPLLKRMPEVNQSLKLPFEHGELALLERHRFAMTLPSDYDLAIVLPNTFKSALIPFHAGIPRRIGWRGEFRRILLTDCRALDRKKYPLMVQRYVALGLDESASPPSRFPYPALRVDPTGVHSSLAALSLQCGKNTLVICPGAEFGEAKQWPARHFSELCKQIVKQSWQVWIMGSANDQAIAAEIYSALDAATQRNCHDLTGKTSLDQAIDILSKASAVVSNDSGLMHVAAALHRPIVALYGSTSPDFTPPLVDRVKLLNTEIECRPCFQRKCPLGHLRCLTEISPNRVVMELQDLLAN
jgi:heptosyltransferase II